MFVLLENNIYKEFPIIRYSQISIIKYPTQNIYIYKEIYKKIFSILRDLGISDIFNIPLKSEHVNYECLTCPTNDESEKPREPW